MPTKSFPPARIQQRHVDHIDIDALIFRQNAPLLLNFLIVPAEAVDALDVEQIVLFHFPQQLFVLRALKVLSALLVEIDILLRYIHFAHGDKLAALVLLLRADAYIAI